MRTRGIFKSNVIMILSITFLLSICLSFTNFKELGTNNFDSFHPDKDLRYRGTLINYQEGDSLNVFYDDEGSQSGISEHNLIDLWIKPDSTGKFEFKLPSYGHLGRMALEFKRKNHGGGQIGRYDGYIVEPGDDINIQITMNGPYNASAVFSGTGAAKYKLADEVHNNSWDYQSRVLPYTRIYSSHNWLDTFYSNIHQCELNDLAILSNYKLKISPIIYKLMSEEVKADYKKLFCFDIEFLFCSDTAGMQGSHLTPGFRTELIADYKSKYEVAIDTSNSSVLQRSMSWRSYVLARIETDQYVKFGRKPTLREVFDEIKREYSGVLFDKLIAQLLFYPFNYGGWQLASNSDQYEYCVDEGEKSVKTIYIKKALMAKAVLKKGADVFEFSMIDTSGNIVKLSDLRGKVVMIDCWYTGCTGCAVFYKHFKDSIEPTFKNNDHFRVVSINLDPSKEIWIKSLYKDIYTNPGHLNLYASAKDYTRTPLLDYYQINGAPFILLVDKNCKLLLSGFGGFSDSDQRVIEDIQSALQK